MCKAYSLFKTNYLDVYLLVLKKKMSTFFLVNRTILNVDNTFFLVNRTILNVDNNLIFTSHMKIYAMFRS